MLQRIGKVAYKLDLPATTLIHPTFYASQLKATIGSGTVSSMPPNLTADLELVAQPTDILHIRYRSFSPKQDEILVLWKHLPEMDSTWEDLQRMLMVFPSHYL